jgi:uncharacterized repeat protein (TIGR04076 family)
MAPAYRVEVTIKEIRQTGKCSQAHMVGETWIIENNITPTDMCQDAFVAIYPILRTMRYGGAEPWVKNAEIMTVNCPDPNNTVVFELKRTALLPEGWVNSGPPQRRLPKSS